MRYARIIIDGKSGNVRLSTNAGAMTMISTMQALFLTTAVLSLLVALVVFLVFRRESDRSARLWVQGSLLMAAGMLLLTGRAVMPDWIAFGVTNGIMLLAIVLYGYGFTALYRPNQSVSTLGVAVCVCFGLTLWGLGALGLGSYRALVAAVAWTAAHGWIWLGMLRLRKQQPDAEVLFFTVLAALGMLVWGCRIYLTAAVGITLATDLQNSNFLSLLVAHMILLAQQVSYLAARLIDEKDKKLEITRLNASIETLWQERQALIMEKDTVRNELLQDVHDGFGSKLVSARLLAERGMLDPAELTDYLTELINDLHLLVDTLNRDDQRFEYAIADFRHRVQRRHAKGLPRIQWQFELDHLPPMNPRVILNLLRIVQEALSNALRHAQASNIGIAAVFDRERSLLTLTITDDGKGYRDDERAGQGLANMRHRAHKAGASFDISAQAVGTRVTLELTV